MPGGVYPARPVPFSHPAIPHELSLEERLLSDLLARWRRQGSWPRVGASWSAEEVDAFSRLSAEGLVREETGHYRLTTGALLRLGGEAELEGFDRLLPTLQEAFRRQPTHTWSCQELGALGGLPPREVALTLDLFASELALSEALFGEEGGLVEAIQLAATVLRAESSAWLRARLQAQGPLPLPPRLVSLQVEGYRSLQGLELPLGALTVVSGAPGVGKSSLLDCLTLLAYAVEHPLSSGAEALLPPRLHLSLRLASDSARRLHYAVSIAGDTGVPRVTAERLTCLESAREPFVLLDFRNGRGTVRAVTQGPSWPRVRTVGQGLAPDVLALRESLEPRPPVVASVRAFLSGWRFYPGFNVAPGAASRRPTPCEPEPLLTAEGSNLSAVLFHLQVEHPERWRELEAHLRAALPAFQSLVLKPRGGPGTVLGLWREAGVRGELPLAELSESTLRLLCLSALCLSPRKPPLICLDAPERGLPPEWMPELAQLLVRASSETQVLVTTGSVLLRDQVPAGARRSLLKREGRTVLDAPPVS